MRTLETDQKDMVPRDFIAREKGMLQHEWLGQSIRIRFIIVAVCFAIGAADMIFDAVPGNGRVMMTYSALAALVNASVLRSRHRQAPRPWLFWCMQLGDTLMMGMLTSTLGPQGYLGIPFFMFAATAYGLGLPRAARTQLLIGCLVYPGARLDGLQTSVGGTSTGLILTETLCLAVLGWLSIKGPIRYTYRVRSARRALAALERGDFAARLPARAMDDIGFLAVSFNATAEALGNAVAALETEVTVRTRAEAALRAGEQRLLQAERHATALAERMEAVAQEAAHVIAADSPAALTRVLGGACVRVLPMDGFTFALHDAVASTLTEVTERGVSDTRPVPVEGFRDS